RRHTSFSRDWSSDVCSSDLLEVKSLIDRLEEPEFDLFKYLREPLFVSESTPALKVLEILREEQYSLALVVDEYGDVAGLVTVNEIGRASWRGRGERRGRSDR